MTFAYTEALEIKKDFAAVHLAYEEFLKVLRTNLDIMYQQNGKATTAHPPNQWDGPNFKPLVFSNSSSDGHKQQEMELQKQRTEYGLVWIMYMHFAMRSEGVKKSREIFAQARKDEKVPWSVYEASGRLLYFSSAYVLLNFEPFSAALMEYHRSDDKSVASRIFENGLTKFSDEIEYVLRYLSFLISINDRNSVFIIQYQFLSH